MAILNGQGSAIAGQASVGASLNAINAALTINTNDGQGSYRLRVAGTYVGTLQVQGSVDGTTFTTLLPILVGSGAGATVTTLTSAATGEFEILGVAGYKAIRVIMNAFTSGAAIVHLYSSPALSNVKSILWSSDLIQTATGAAGAAVTLTIPAGGAGLFHYITRLSIERHATALLTAGSTPIIVTTTNLAGSLAFSTPVEAAAQGTVWERNFESTAPIKSLAANTATTIVAPTPQTGAIWRITAFYYLYS